MSVLIHINGPPGIGKSTIAQMYVDRHLGVLNLDVDKIRGLIGGWQQRFAETGELVRPIAKAMARTHLEAGVDVVMPQFIGRIDELARFEAVAIEAGGRFCQVVLMDTKERSVDRFSSRGGDDGDVWHQQVKDIVGDSGGDELLRSMYDQLTEIVQARTDAVVVSSSAGAIMQTYDTFASAIPPSARDVNAGRPL